MFKYCDVGLLRVKANMPASEILIDTDNMSHFKGSLVENYALNEFISVLGDSTSYCYWMNDKGHAEVDFLVNINGCTVPIEVKAGTDYSVRSIRVYMDKHHPENAFVISGRNLKRGELTFVPLCLIYGIKELMRVDDRH